MQGPHPTTPASPATSPATSNAARVRDFHHATGTVYPTTPTVPAPDVLALRLTLLQEEMTEVQDAARILADHPHARPRDVTPLAHELVDLLYVTYGALQALGVDADTAFAEIHRVNMLKTTGPRRADGKQLKPEGWQPADLARTFGLD